MEEKFISESLQRELYRILSSDEYDASQVEDFCEEDNLGFVWTITLSDGESLDYVYYGYQARMNIQHDRVLLKKIYSEHKKKAYG